MNDRRVVLVTGCAGGIGRAVCSLFYENGWYVIGTDQHCEAKVEGVSSYIDADLFKDQDVEKIFNSVYNVDSDIFCLVNNAAYQVCASIEDTSLADWDKVFAVNVRAPFQLIKKFASLLKKTKGSVVNVTSVHSYASSPDIAAYASSKGALHSLTRNAAIEFAKYGVRVNAVAPGAVDTEMLRAGLDRGHLQGTDIDAKLTALGKKHLLGKVASAWEIAEMIYFLSDNKKASNITGQSFVVDGGALAKLGTES